MNSCEDGTEPLGESPAVEPSPTNYPEVQPVTYYRARCTECGAYAEYCDFGAFADAGSAVEAARDDCDWFERTRREPAPTPEIPNRAIVHTVELLCRDCQKCDACGSAPAYVSPDDDEHLVCGDHEDYFAEAVGA
jgi:ferredoxin